MMVLLAVFYSVTEAQVACAYLRSRGFAPFLADENTLNANPFYTLAIGGVRVLIREQEKCAADCALQEFSRLSDSVEEPYRCPICLSDKVLPEPERPKEVYAHFRCFDCDHSWDDRHLKNINPGHIE